MVSIEELARELPAALKGKADISFGNVIGSALAIFLFNAGIIALTRPVTIEASVLEFYLPACLATMVFSCVIVYLTKQLPRWAGIVLIGLYLFFWQELT